MTDRQAKSIERALDAVEGLARRYVRDGSWQRDTGRGWQDMMAEARAEITALRAALAAQPQREVERRTGWILQALDDPSVPTDDLIPGLWVDLQKAKQWAAQLAKLGGPVRILPVEVIVRELEPRR